jgi:hypothetical protein
MIRNCLLTSFIFLSCCCNAQQLSQVTFAQASDFTCFSLLSSQNILIRISADGKILEYGTEQASLNNKNYFAPKLVPYSGTVGYYEHEPDSTLNGKIKNIGSCFFTWYGFKDYPEKAGKLKSANSIVFDYYRKYEDPLNGGKLKNIGRDAISFYNSFDNDAYKGKLKSVGNSSISYYSSFDNQSLKGKVKTIGNYTLPWGTTNNGREFVSYLKTGNQRELINGISYILQ